MKHTLGLTAPLPFIGADQYYQLLLVGPISADPEFGCTITLFFQQYQPQQLFESPSLPISRQARISNAAVFVPGTCWDNRGSHQTIALTEESRSLTLGPSSLRLAQLRDIKELTVLKPGSFWSKHQDMWIAIVQQASEQLIIPCFELLRALYYHAGPRIIDYCFSQLPWELLARLINKGSGDLSRIQMQVASSYLTVYEAVILGGLLTDPLYIRTLNQAQAWWQSLPRNSNVKFTGYNYAKATGQISHEVLFDATGYLLEDQYHFWVTSLSPLTSLHTFHSVLYHGLAKHNKDLLKRGTPFCSDLLETQRNTFFCAQMHPIVDTCLFNKLQTRSGPSAQLNRLSRVNSPSMPIVTRGFEWAQSLTKKEALRGCQTLNQKPTSYSLSKKLLVHIQELDRVLNAFRSTGQDVTTLQLYNDFSHFGHNVSVFPHHGCPPLLGTPYKHRVRYFHLFQIETVNSLLFIIHLHNIPDIVFICQKRNLKSPNQREWEILLQQLYTLRKISDIQDNINKINLHLSHHSQNKGFGLIIRAIPYVHLSPNLCNELTTRTIVCLRRRLAVQLGINLNHPDGLHKSTWKLINRHLVQTFFRSPTPEWDIKVKFLWENFTKKSS